MTKESEKPKGQQPEQLRRPRILEVEVPPGSRGSSITEIARQNPNFQVPTKDTAVVGNKSE